MNYQNISSPEDQSVTFVELFFDLVFVFSATQVVGLLHDGLSGLVIGQAVLVFWLVWWAWTQFTWALNAANTDNAFIESGTLLATAVAFFMAVSLPGAFGGLAVWFALTYVIVRSIGLIMYYWVTSQDPQQRSAVRVFFITSTAGLLAVLIGSLLGGTWQYLLWGLAIILDVVAAQISGRVEGWRVHPEHFAERHGLFVIIALGETLIVAAGQFTGEAWTGPIVTVAVLAVALTCGLWWTYFPRAKPVLEEALCSSDDLQRTQIARDSYSLIHFLMVLGIIAYAFVVEEGVAHPNEALPLEGRIALAAGLLLFVGGMAAAIWRATRQVLIIRLLVTLTAGTLIIFIPGLPVASSLTVAVLAILIIIVVEQRRLSAVHH